MLRANHFVVLFGNLIPYKCFAEATLMELSMIFV